MKQRPRDERGYTVTAHPITFSFHKTSCATINYLLTYGTKVQMKIFATRHYYVIETIKTLSLLHNRVEKFFLRVNNNSACKNGAR